MLRLHDRNDWTVARRPPHSVHLGYLHLLAPRWPVCLDRRNDFAGHEIDPVDRRSSAGPTLVARVAAHDGPAHSRRLEPGRLDGNLVKRLNGRAIRRRRRRDGDVEITAFA